MTSTEAGDQWRDMLAAAREQLDRLGDPEWRSPPDRYQARVDSFRGPARSDDGVVDLLAAHLTEDDRVLDVGAGAGRFSIPFARRVKEVVALEPSPSMAEALRADAAAAGVGNIKLLPEPWEQAPDDLSVAVSFSAHVVYSLPKIEDFLLFLEKVARRWAAVVLFGGPAQSRVNGVWKAVYGEDRRANPGLPQLLSVLWSLERYPDVTMIDVPPWPLGNFLRARRSLQRRLHVIPGSEADARLEAAMQTLMVDWGDGQLGPADRRSLKLAIVRWPVARS